LEFRITGGVEHHLDADCQVIYTRRALRVGYSIPFDTMQLQAMRSSPLMSDMVNSFHGRKAHGKLYVCDGRVEHVSLVSADGNEIEWLTQSRWSPYIR
jgi:hypothetical protein